MAKALKHFTPNTVLGYDMSSETVEKAKLLEAIDNELCEKTLPLCDIVVIALYPNDCVEYVKKNARLFKDGALVMDCCGVKESVCSELFPIALQSGFHFVGAHPMAGIERSGFDNSVPTLFQNASVILTPSSDTEDEIVKSARKFFGSVGFNRCEICTPQHHDRVIAFTSQLAHVVSGAFVKSPTALEHSGFSAGSYRDLTRVAKLNADMWCELFLHNSQNLINEIDEITKNLANYKAALTAGDREQLTELLQEGTRLKEQADSREMN